MNKTIIFIRHGKPLLRSFYSMVKPVKGKYFNEYCREYKLSTIDPAYPPPETLVHTIGNGSHFISSNLRRARDSCTMLQFPNTIFSESFREAEMPHTELELLSLPLILWMAVSHIKWRMGIACDTSESKQAFKMRIQGARDLLHQEARQKDSIVVMTHGILIHYLKKALLEKGWRVGKASIRHWGVTQLNA